MLHINLAFIGKAVSEKRMFAYYSNIHVDCPGMGTDQYLGIKHFKNHKSSVHLPISFKFFPSNDILTIVPIQIQGQPMLTLL